MRGSGDEEHAGLKAGRGAGQAVAALVAESRPARKMAAEMPDLSHLTAEERAIIESVMMRQKQEEQRENEIMRRKQDEVAILEDTIRQRSEQQRRAGVELDATCHICLKTKFADGVGHVCNYCNIRCCARCGGKVTLRSNKVIWVCILCRKKQELLSKTGQWIQKSAGQDAIMWRIEADMRAGEDPTLGTDKRPKLERARSAAEKENLPLQRSTNVLRRQYSQQDPRNQDPDNYRVEDESQFYDCELDTMVRTHPHLLHGKAHPYDLRDDSVIAPPPDYTQPTTRHPQVGSKKHKRGSSRSGVYPGGSFSSSEDELRSTPECGSDDNEDYRRDHHKGDFNDRSFESEADSRWEPSLYKNGDQQAYGVDDSLSYRDRTMYKSAYLWEDSSDNRRFTERRKKTVRFDGNEGSQTFPRAHNRDAQGYDWATVRWDSDRQGSQDSTTKDSGIDTSSTFTSSEDSNRGDGPKFPLAWQVSTDGTRMIGHMVLRKSVVDGPNTHSGAAILGLKVVGGKLFDGTRGAFIEKVKKGSIADLEGQLRIGDEVIQWGGTPLQGKTAEEVYNIISDSKHDTQVELVVSRVISSNRRAAQVSWRTHKDVYTDVISGGGGDKPSVLVTSPGSPDVHASAARLHPRHSRHHGENASVGGRLQVKLLFDHADLQLAVTLVGAQDLVPRANGHARCPYAKIFLLPDISEKSKRRTKTLANTNDPRWSQTFVYSGLRIADLRQRALEVTVWDLTRERNGPNDFLGEVVMDLNMMLLNDELEWFTLKPHEEAIIHTGRYRADLMEPDIDGNIALTPTDHLSPPSTSTSRLSDSDTPSECDLDVERDRRVADGASVSSVGSSSSPPPPDEMDVSRRSRRDMSPQGRHRSAGMARDTQPNSYTHSYRRNNGATLGQRSHSAAPTEHPSLHRDVYDSHHGRSRSKSPRRSLSPPENAWSRYTDFTYGNGQPVKLPLHSYVPRFQSRSATATPTGSPKKRQLPQIPQLVQRALKSQTSAELEERRWQSQRYGITTLSYRTSSQGWERPYAGLSESDLAGHLSRSRHIPRHAPRHQPAPRRRDSPERQERDAPEPGDSDMESVGSVTSSAFSTQSERPRGSNMMAEYSSGSQRGRSHTGPRNGENEPAERGRDTLDRRDSRRGQFTRSLSNADVPPDEKTDGSLSDTAVMQSGAAVGETLRKSEPLRARDHFGSGMGKKSNSTSQLSATELGGGGGTSHKKRSSAGCIQRSQEVLPVGGTATYRASSLASISSSEGSSWSPGLRMGMGSGGSSEAVIDELSGFIDGLGPGQMVGRQVLGASSLGDIQLSLCHQKGYLEVEVIRARGLQRRSDCRSLPAPYVKLYLVNGKTLLAKNKTSSARNTLEPLYQQVLTFHKPYQGCLLQVTVWGDYGKLHGRKVFMGVAEIVLDQLNLSNIVIGWYKLFSTVSLGGAL